jgi:hypothetical protein
MPSKVHLFGSSLGQVGSYLYLGGPPAGAGSPVAIMDTPQSPKTAEKSVAPASVKNRRFGCIHSSRCNSDFLNSSQLPRPSAVSRSTTGDREDRGMLAHGADHDMSPDILQICSDTIIEAGASVNKARPQNQLPSGRKFP